MKKTCTVLALSLLTAASVFAQDGQRPRPNGDKPPGGRRMMPPPPVMAALDANKDGVIDAAEIANASAALAKLDKNEDGKLTEDELRPAHPPGGHPPGEAGQDK